MTKDVHTRFKEKYVVDESTGCWNWTGARICTPPRYGSFWVDKGFQNNRMSLAHRASYYLHKGVHPGNAHVLHSCDNTFCVNPEHLSLGNHQDNMRDMVAKKRHKIPTQKLNNDLLKLGKLLRGKGWEVLQISKVLGISSSHCSRVLRDYCVY